MSVINILEVKGSVRWGGTPGYSNFSYVEVWVDRETYDRIKAEKPTHIDVIALSGESRLCPLIHTLVVTNEKK